ncbi:ImmA/IrrE family metallo-endopeptidase [Staphylococcus agnetis]|uniref:ImmA/IrrE family metallo-endopeptidase n=1 Tax=Staphylococcus agnetis TaxID=985762 RepID=A0AAW9YW55_9STAP|nr:ImmA/IrrE family metallo-endopeptidase [Staphylococcus agnetis]NJI02200.1 ImmA/IrrE family metallo-endopeptidase [Staphylococcus agnetis]
MSKKHKISKSRKKELEDEVTKTVRKFKEDYPQIKSPIENSYLTIEKMGFFIIGKKLDDDISGFHLNIGKYKCIFINRNHHYARQNQSLWHEIYHWYTNDIGHISSKNAIEYEEMEYKAENFASKILIDRDNLKDVILLNNIKVKYIKRREIVQLQNHYSASYMNVARALYEEYPNEFNPNRMNLGLRKNHEKLIEFCKKEDLDYSIYNIPKSDYITGSFIEDLKQNYIDNKITLDYLEDILNLIDEELNIGE